MNRKYLTLLGLVLAGCGADTHVTNTTIQDMSGPTESGANDVISEMVQIENTFRNASGNNHLTPGLKCSMYTVATNTSSIPANPGSVKHNFGYVGSFNQENSSASLGLNILPDGLRPTYTSWYVMRCTGVIAIAEPGFKEFSTTSDDGSVLYVNNVKVVDNNGNHSTQTKFGGLALNKGFYAFRLDYMQATGNQSLIVRMDDEVIPSNLFYR